MTICVCVCNIIFVIVCLCELFFAFLHGSINIQ